MMEDLGHDSSSAKPWFRNSRIMLQRSAVVPVIRNDSSRLFISRLQFGRPCREFANLHSVAQQIGLCCKDIVFLRNGADGVARTALVPQLRD